MGFEASSPTRQPSKQPIYLSLRSSNQFILSTIALASFTDTFLYSIVVPVFPTSLTERANIAPDDVQIWLSILLAIYGGVLFVAAPVSAVILDRCTSRRIPFLSGLVTLIAATAMLCVGNSIGLLIPGRVISGASAGLLWTASAAIITANVDKDAVGQALGVVALALNMGSLAGPILGGVVYQHGGYYAVFGMAFGVLGMDVVLRLVMIEKVDAKRWIPAEAATTTLQDALDNDVELNVLDTSRSSDVQMEEGQPQAPKPRKRRLPVTIRLLCSYRILITVFGSFIMACIVAAFETVLPLYVETVFGFSSTGAGLIFLPLVLPSLIDPWIGNLCDKHPALARYFAAGGFIGAVCPLVLLRLVTHSGIRQVVLLCSLLMLIGLCLTITTPPLLFEVNRVIEEMEKADPSMFGSRGAIAQRYGLFISAFAGGSLIGPLLAGLVKDRFGWGAMTWVLGLLSGFAAPFMLLCVGGWIGGAGRQSS